MGATPTPTSRSGLLLIGLFLAAVLAQGAVLRSGWVLDDQAVVRANPAIRQGVQEVFQPEQWPGALAQGAWRPLSLTSFAVLRPLWEKADGDLDPLGPHLVNLFLHALSTLLLWAVLRGLFPRRGALAFWSALLFAVHPLHTGTVSMMTGRAELLGFAFGAGALALWARAFTPRVRPPVVAGALVCLLLACLSHEAAMAWVPALLAVGLWHARSALATALPLVPALVFLLVWPGVPSGPEGIGASSPTVAPVQGVAAAGRTLVRLVAPVALVGDHTDRAHPVEGFTTGRDDLAFAGLGLLFLLVAFLVGRVRRESALAAFLGVALASGLVASLVSAPGAALELRFAYIVLPALLGVLGLAFEALTASWFGTPAGSAPSIPGLVACGLATLGLVGVAHAEAAHWRTDEAFHDHLLVQRPGHMRALLRQARRARLAAATQREIVMGLPSQLQTGQPNPAYEAAREALRGHIAEGKDWITRVHATPEGRALADAWQELGAIQHEASRWPEAARALEHVWELDEDLRDLADPEAVLPEDPRRRREAAELYHLSGRVRGALGERGTQAAHLTVAARLAPGSAQYQRDAGIALVTIRSWPEALQHLERAVRAAATPEERASMQELLDSSRQRAREMAAMWFRQAKQYFTDGNHGAAVELHEAAAGADPLLTDAWIEAARLRGDWFGNYVTARRHLDAAESALKNTPGADTSRLEDVRKWKAWLEKRRQEDNAEEAAGGGG